MKIAERKSSRLNHILLLVFWLTLMPLIASAAQSAAERAPGLSMAQQATKSEEHWITTDHSKHEILQRDFKAGEEITAACISCHSEAEKQFHKTIHWTWLADPSDKARQYGKAGNSLNNFCISTNKIKRRQKIQDQRCIRKIRLYVHQRPDEVGQKRQAQIFLV